MKIPKNFLSYAFKLNRCLAMATAMGVVAAANAEAGSSDDTNPRGQPLHERRVGKASSIGPLSPPATDSAPAAPAPVTPPVPSTDAPVAAASTAEVPPKSAPKVATAEDKEKFNQEADALEKDSSGGKSDGTSSVSDHCQNSVDINGKYGCDRTKNLIDASKISNAIGQSMGSVGTQIAGQQGQANAAAEGTQSSALHAAATTQRAAGGSQVAAGSVNVVFGALQIAAGSVHNRQSTEANTEAKKQAQADRMLAHNKLEEAKAEMARGNTAIAEKYKKEAEALLSHAKQQEKLGKLAQGEQTKIAGEATGAGLTTLITGTGMVTQGSLNLSAADNLDAAARKLKEAEGKVASFSPPGADAFPSASGGTTNSVRPITGNGLNSAALASTEDPTKDAGDGGDLGRGFNPNGPGDGLKEAPPTPGNFVGKDQSPSGGGGGGGLGGGGSTAAATGTGDTEPTSRLADGKSGGYDGGSGGSFSGGGGGAGVGANGGPDLSGMLAAFLPKKDDEDGKKGILDFASRGPAGEQPISLLDRNTNIFERIHDTYQFKQKDRRIGM